MVRTERRVVSPADDREHGGGDPVAVLGAGAWGTALALALARNGARVRLWSHRPEHAGRMAADGENRDHLAGCPLPSGITPTSSLAEAVDGAAWTLIAVPSHAFQSLVSALAAQRGSAGNALERVAWATKGLDATSGGLLHQVIEAAWGGTPSMAVLSGPSFAREVAEGRPTAVAVATNDPEFGELLVAALHQERFRVYTSADLVGVELGGAVKNVLAVATGICDGLELGANARAALITRGLAEISRLGRALDADPLTFTGLAGVGDLILTCTDNQSRNRRFGLAIGAGGTVDAALESVGSTVEAVRTARELHALAAEVGVEMPICETVHRVLEGELDARGAVELLLLREPKAEFDD